LIKPITVPFVEWCAGISVTSNYVILDTETTGKYGEVIDIAIIDGMGQELYQSLLKPRGAIEPGAEAVHHISESMLASAPTIEDEWSKICDIVDGRTVITYNARFDSERIETSLRAYGLEYCSWCQWRYQCAMIGYADFWGAPPTKSWSRNAPWQSLGNACAQQKIDLPPGLHRAMPDVKATFLLIAKIAAMGEQSPRFADR
jgi:DNA polymerase-3 subunit epsilon